MTTKLDFQSLDWRQFELLCGGLLAAMGFRNIRPFAKAGQPDRGVDWVFETSEGKLKIAQVKHVRRGILSPTQLRLLIDDFRTRNFSAWSRTSDPYAIFLLSQDLTHGFDSRENIEIWDAEYISEQIKANNVVLQNYLNVTQEQKELEAAINDDNIFAKESIKANELITRLKSRQTGT